jgi:GNAT superfamily N-acetyltransferase
MFFANYSSFMARPVMYLEDIFILEEHRRKGYGGAMFDHAVSEAVENGYGRMEWCVLDWNEPAQRFYEKNDAERLGWYFYRLPREEMERRARGAPSGEGQATGGSR